MAITLEERIERLSTVSLKRVVEPDEAVPGGVGPGQVLPTELLSIAGLDLDLTPEQLVRLSREEVASITSEGIRFESVLTAGFSMEIVRKADLTDPRVTYILHELGEETRHSRLFVRLLSQLAPQAKNPLNKPILNRIQSLVLPFLMGMPAFFCILVLTGEEIPDLMQKLASEHPDTDPFVREVNKYHRQEEARHLAFARLILPELWEKAGRFERFMIRRVAPLIVGGMFDLLVHPGVYETVGLPGWETWRKANRSPQRVGLRHRALRPLLSALIDAGALKPGRIPSAWQKLCGVGAKGEPVAERLNPSEPGALDAAVAVAVPAG
ncbi:MAG TPA: diiron oxygenase [Acidimicrobiales bacterium]|nr:diiron oxygenase [Acidimicrobiales bacterium]